jgi:hypothetical protein
VFQGHDTITSNICWTIQMLGKNQVIQVPNPGKWGKKISNMKENKYQTHLGNSVEFVMKNSHNFN